MVMSDKRESRVEEKDQSVLQERYLKTLDNLSEGQLIDGVVVQTAEDTIFVDVGYKSEGKIPSEEFDENTLHVRQLLKTKLIDMDLSVRALNCLKAADVDTLGELVAFNKNDLLKFRNFGRKSLTELEDLVKTKSLEFGMNISKYKLDKD